MKRYSRRLDDRYGEGAVLRLFQSPDELVQLRAGHRRRLREDLPARARRGRAHAEAEQALQLLAAEHGWLRAFVLYLDGVPRAFWHGTLYRRIFYTGPHGL